MLAMNAFSVSVRVSADELWNISSTVFAIRDVSAIAAHRIHSNNRIERIPGVVAVSRMTWFGGTNRASMAVGLPESYAMRASELRVLKGAGQSLLRVGTSNALGNLQI